MARNLRNRANIAMRAAKTEYIKKQLGINRKDPKKFWNVIHSEILPEDKATIFKFGRMGEFISNPRYLIWLIIIFPK